MTYLITITKCLRKESQNITSKNQPNVHIYIYYQKYVIYKIKIPSTSKKFKLH